MLTALALLLLALSSALLVVRAKLRRDAVAARHKRVMRDIAAVVEVTPAKLQATKPSAIVQPHGKAAHEPRWWMNN